MDKDRSKCVRLAILANISPKKLGSFEDWLVEFSREMMSDHRVTVGSHGPVHEEFAARLSAAGVDWMDLRECGTTGLAVARELGRRFDVVHLSLFAPRAPISLGALISPRTRVIFQDCFSTPLEGSEASQSHVSRALDRLTFLRLETLSAVSNFVAQRDLRRFRVPSAKVRVVYNGVSIERFAPPLNEPERPTILCVASMTKEKGIDTLLRGYEMLPAPRPPLRVIGEGPELPTLRQLATTLNIGDTVTFVGLSDHVHEEMVRAAVVVHPAHWGEAFGLTIAEAMACGRTVIASSIGAIPELIEHEHSGLLVRAADHLELGAAMLRAMNDPALRAQLGRAARDRARERFSMTNWVAESARLVRQGRT